MGRHYTLEDQIGRGLLQAIKARGKTPEDYDHDPLRAAMELGVHLEKRDTVMDMLDVSATTITRYIRNIEGVSRGRGVILFTQHDIDQLRALKRRPGRPVLEMPRWT